MLEALYQMLKNFSQMSGVQIQKIYATCANQRDFH